MSGYRHHHWKRTVGQDTTAPYYEDYDHNAAGVGLLASVAVTPELVLGVQGFVGSNVSPSLLISVPNNPTSFNLDLGTKLDVEAGARFDYAVAPHWHLLLEYALVSFGYGPSNVLAVTPQLSLEEPDSSTVTHEVRGGVAFGF